MFARYFELYFKDIISKKRKGLLPTLILLLLYPFSLIYSLVVACRNWLYNHGCLKRYVPPVPLVVSIGNIVAGGTGKTPVTALLTKAFYDNFSVAILSRGYRSPAEKMEEPVVLSAGEGPRFPAAFCGDEPFALAKNFPKAHIVVGKDRKKSSILVSKEGVQVIFLDDGMQHRRLARDFDVVVLDAHDPFGQGYYLPRGFLRESLRSLQRAHLVILNHVDSVEQFSATASQIARYSCAPIVGTTPILTAVRTFTGEQLQLPIKGRTMGMFSSIAHPDYFKKMLENEGVKISQELNFPDHYMDEKALDNFARRCQNLGIDTLICTEKDRVKLRENLTLPIPILWVQIELKIIEGLTEWNQFIQTAKSKIGV